MNTHTFGTIGLIALAVVTFFGITPVLAETNNASESVYLFTSFRGNGDGLHLALSNDGFDWADVDGVFFEPTVGDGLMRDPHILDQSYR